MSKHAIWRPVEAPRDPDSLQVSALRSFEQLWQKQRQGLHRQDALRDFNERMARWWSIETGIIERLYDVSEGITLQLIEHGFEASLIPHGESTLNAEDLVYILKDHRESLDFMMDIVGGARELSTSWICELHALLTRHQGTTEALDSFGNRIQVPLLRGAWKQRSNNPMTFDGVVHEYCPPEHVAAQMDHLLAIYHSLPPYPEVRAAWLHHAFTQIHPFQDGNGRVARVLASIDFIKHGLFHMLVRRQEREDYIRALRAADDGDLGVLVRYFSGVQEYLLSRAISEAVQVVDSKANMDQVLVAAAQKLQAREQDARHERAQLAARMESLLNQAAQVFEHTKLKILEQVGHLQEISVTRAAPEHRHWFRQQLLHLGQEHDHWVDLNEYRDWVRLQLKNGGVTDIVVACHFIGNPSPGWGVAVIFVEHRDPREQVGLNPPFAAAAPPLLMGFNEDAQHQRARFLAWLEHAQVTALAQWTKFL